MGIPYGVVDGLALFLHGYRRFTEDVDLLVAKESLARIHQELERRGWLLGFGRSPSVKEGEGVREEGRQRAQNRKRRRSKCR